MKHKAILTVTSLLSILLLSIHVTDDIVRGFDRWGFDKLSFVLILVVWLCGTLLLAERRSGNVIMLLGGLMAALMPAIHSRGAVPPRQQRLPGRVHARPAPRDDRAGDESARIRVRHRPAAVRPVLLHYGIPDLEVRLPAEAGGHH